MKLRLPIQLLSIVISSLVSASSALSADKTWSGTGNWSDASHWSDNALPATGDNLKITDNAELMVDGTYTIADISIALSAGKKVIIKGGGSSFGILHFSGTGNLTTGGQIQLGDGINSFTLHNTSTADNRIAINDATELIVQERTNLEVNRLIVGNDKSKGASLVLNGGTIKVTKNTTAFDVKAPFVIAHHANTGSSSTTVINSGLLDVCTGAGVVGVLGSASLDVRGGVADFKVLYMGGYTGVAIESVLKLHHEGRLNLGEGGLKVGGTGTEANISIQLSDGGVLGAFADWESSLTMTLTGTDQGIIIDTSHAVVSSDPEEGVPANHKITLSGKLTGNGGFVKEGAGTLVLMGENNDYLGLTKIVEGMLQVGTGNWSNGKTASLGKGKILISEDGTLGVSTGKLLDLNNEIETLDGAHFRILDGMYKSTVNYRLSGLVSMNGAFNLVATWSENPMEITGKLTDGTIKGKGKITFKTPDDNGSLNIYILNPDNDYSGGTVVGNKINLILGDDPNTPSGSLGSGLVEMQTGSKLTLRSLPASFHNDFIFENNSSIAIQGGNDYIFEGAMALMGNLSINDVWGKNYSLNGILSDYDSTVKGSLTLNHANGITTATLAGDNTYSGGTTIASGVLLNLGVEGGTTGTLGTGDITLNGALQFNRTNTYEIRNNISGSGRIVQHGSGTTILSGTNTYTGETKLEDGILQIASMDSLGNGGPIVFFGGCLLASGNLEMTGRQITVGSGQSLHFAAADGKSMTILDGLPFSEGALNSNLSIGRREVQEQFF